MEKLCRSNSSHYADIRLSGSSRSSARPVASRRQYIFQACIFILTYLTYASLKAGGESWAYLKDRISSQKPPGIGLSGKNLGFIDMVFLGFLSAFTFIAGIMGDSYNKRFLISTSYIIVGGSGVLIGCGGIWGINDVYYYLSFFAINGAAQSLARPIFIAVMGNWFGKTKRGILFGIWTTNTNVGNILSGIMGNLFIVHAGFNWMWTWMTMNFIVGVFGLLNIILLIDHPSKVSLEIVEFYFNSELDEPQSNDTSESIYTSVFNESRIENLNTQQQKSIRFIDALLIPGVIEFSIGCMGARLGHYGMFFWLPKFSHDELKFNENLKTLIIIGFDLGSIFGNILLGYMSDMLYGKRSIVCFLLILVPIGCIIIIFLDKDQKILIFILIFILGFLIGGVSNMITVTVSTDLAKQDLLKNDYEAQSTVAGIVNGIGSIGATFGQLAIGAIQTKSWRGVFILIAVGTFLSSLSLTRILIKEIKEIYVIRVHNNNQDQMQDSLN